MMAMNTSSGVWRDAAITQRRVRLLAWLSGVLFLFMGAGYVAGPLGRAASALVFVDIVFILLLGIPLVYRLTRQHLLWRVRNKLIITYLLIGLAPMLLFFALFTLAAYVAAGQFAIHLATTRLDADVAALEVDSVAFAQRLPAIVPRIEGRGEPGVQETQPAIETTQAWQAAAFVDGKPLFLRGAMGHARSPLWPPQWFAQGSTNDYHGIVLEDSTFYLAAMTRQKLPDGRTLITIGSVPLNNILMDRVAQNLGTVRLAPDGAEFANAMQGSETSPKEVAGMKNVLGGLTPHSANMVDVAVHFFSSISVLLWDSNRLINVPIVVTSRPSLLYRELFGAALTGGITSLLRGLFIAVCVLCGLLELFALTMAMRLNNTITQSVEGLYEATQHVDRGNLRHRIDVRHDDQMAELCSSFNRMSSSLARLLDEQKEKERLQNELSIAQEVQANLFPLAELRLPTLELHGICRPARSVSGDYYDFLLFHGENGEPTGASIALGDISGKGISAALLMATLHSAVRAYRFGAEDLTYNSDIWKALNAERNERSVRHQGDLFQSPSRILSLLNRHLYRSTQPEKYATLFLAHYEEKTRKLVYSNAGHLPPILLCADGSMRRLDCGGTVVGLMDGMRYEEEAQTLGPGDLLIAFSDGVTEPENDFGEFGEVRLMEVVRENRHASLDVISARVMEALDAWIGAEEQPDDITLVLARGV
ncbi:MAG: SpoIIE family protein phosphatase [Acidobacteria bacterium]|nr:SpoIIE family protein phosphatase [Acidobacteriota bacterium]